jgi:hypothetical protein
MRNLLIILITTLLFLADSAMLFQVASTIKHACFIIFAADAKRGEHLKFKATRVGSRFAIGEPVQA